MTSEHKQGANKC